MFFKLLFGLLLVNLLCDEISSRHHHLEPKYYCGPNIANVLSILCKGNYASPEVGKRASLFGVYQPPLDTYDVNYFNNMEGNGVFTYEDFLVKRGREETIYDECCKNPCTLEQLQWYCAKEQKVN